MQITSTKSLEDNAPSKRPAENMPRATPGNILRPQHMRALNITCPGKLRDWSFTVHARDRMASRDFSPHQVLAACEHPEWITASLEPELELRYRGHLAVLVNSRTHVVVTVLLRSRSRWTDADARAIGGRHV